MLTWLFSDLDKTSWLQIVYGWLLSKWLLYEIIRFWILLIGCWFEVSLGLIPHGQSYLLLLFLLQAWIIKISFFWYSFGSIGSDLLLFVLIIYGFLDKFHYMSC